MIRCSLETNDIETELNLGSLKTKKALPRQLIVYSDQRSFRSGVIVQHAENQSHNPDHSTGSYQSDYTSVCISQL